MTQSRTPAMLMSGLLIAAMAVPAAASEPPLLEGLQCTVQRQQVDGGLRLEIGFDNGSGQAVSLPPGPHLVYYEDAGAARPMGITVRVDRVQKSPLTVPAGGRVIALYGADAGLTEALRCNGRPPAAAALYFYRHSQRPQFRCLLAGHDPAALPMNPDCPAGTPLAPATGPRP